MQYRTLFILLFLPLLLAADSPVILVVTAQHAATNQPVPAASITIEGILHTFQTNPQGEARIGILPPGEYTITVRAAGYFDNTAKRVAAAAGQVVSLAIHLHPQPVLQETMAVTATGTPYSVQDAPIRTEVLTQEYVDKQIKTTLAEAFQATVSGVRMEMNCQNCGFMQVRINGLEGPYTQILEDGLPTYSGVTAVYGLEQIPTAFVEQIEVVKGGNSALYGPGAVAGVVNVIRREARENRFRLDAMSGWHYGRPEQQAGAAAQISTLPLGFAADLYYRGSNRVAVDRDRDGFSDMGKRRLDTGGFGLTRRFFHEAAKLSVTGATAYEFRRGGDQFDRPSHQTWITEQIDSRRNTLALAWNQTLSPRAFYNLRASHAYYSRDTYYGSGMDPNAYGDTRNPLWVGDAQAGYQAGKHSLLAGYQLSWEHVADHAPAYQRTYGGTFRNDGVYLQDEWRPAARFTLIGGARLDRSNQLHRTIVSPRAGAKYAWRESLVWRASVSTGFRAPAVFDEDLHIAQVGGEGFLLQNDPALREERSISYSTGFDAAGSIRGRRLQLASNFFYTRLRHTFTLTEDHTPGGYRRLFRVNGTGSHVAGVSFDANMRLRPSVGLRTGYTAQQARWKDAEPQFGARDFFRTPNRYGFAGVDFSLPAKIEISTTLDYTGPMTVPHYAGYIDADRLERSNSFAVVNAVVSRIFATGDHSRCKLFFNLQNIGDSFQPDLDRGPMRDSAYVYGPSEMRRAVVGLTLEF